MVQRRRFQGENRKEYLRITRIFDAEDGCFWVKRRRFRFFKQALILTAAAGLAVTLIKSVFSPKPPWRFPISLDSIFCFLATISESFASISLLRIPYLLLFPYLFGNKPNITDSVYYQNEKLRQHLQRIAPRGYSFWRLCSPCGF